MARWHAWWNSPALQERGLCELIPLASGIAEFVLSLGLLHVSTRLGCLSRTEGHHTQDVLRNRLSLISNAFKIDRYRHERGEVAQIAPGERLLQGQNPEGKLLDR